MRALLRFLPCLLTGTLVAADLPVHAQEQFDQYHTALDPGPAPSSMLPPEMTTGASFDPGAGVITQKSPQKANIDGREVDVYNVESVNAGFYAPDGKGGYLFFGSDRPMVDPNPVNEAARELKLKVRELADQLLAGMQGQPLSGVIALPTSFVNQDNFAQSSSLGRYIAEQMFFEFNQRGVPVREYRMAPGIDPAPGQGEFLLSRQISDVPHQRPDIAVLVGTYYSDAENVFVNARLIHGETGMVLRTGSMVFAQTTVSRQMLAKTGVSLAPSVTTAMDFETATQGARLTDIDQGFDIQ